MSHINAKKIADDMNDEFKKETMLYKVRTGDILLCNDESHNRTQMYLITYDSIEGYTLVCLSCGSIVGSYKHNKDLLLKDMKGFLNVTQIIPKEILADFVTSKYNPTPKVFQHDICCEHELGIEIEL